MSASQSLFLLVSPVNDNGLSVESYVLTRLYNPFINVSKLPVPTHAKDGSSLLAVIWARCQSCKFFHIGGEISAIQMQLSSVTPSSWSGCASQGPLLRLSEKSLVTRFIGSCVWPLHSAVEYLCPGRRTWFLTWYASKLKTTSPLKMFSW